MKVSVLINNFNYGDFIKEAVDSVLCQENVKIEVIVYDDGSIDNSLEVLKQYGQSIQVISNENFGSYPSINQANAIECAFEKSTGDIIFLLDSDDVFWKGKVQRVVEVFNEDPKIVCVQHTFDVIGKQSEKLKIKKRPILSGIEYPDAMFFTGSIGYFFSQTSSLAFRREYLGEIFPFDKEAFFMQWPDIRLTRNAMYYGTIVTLQENLGGYRVHSNNDSNKLKNKSYNDKFIKEHVDFLNVLSKKYINKEFKYKGRIKSIFLVFYLNLISKRSLRGKLDFYKNFLFRK